jgi:hypothetical protein
MIYRARPFIFIFPAKFIDQIKNHGAQGFHHFIIYDKRLGRKHALRIKHINRRRLANNMPSINFFTYIMDCPHG